MDLGSLLNQSNQTLSTREIQELLNETDSSIKLDRIANATFGYPASLQESYVFFDAYIQLLLSIQYVDEAYGPQYSKSVISGSFRSCVDGLLRQHGLSWLLEFPGHFSQETWASLHSTQDTTVLLLLYGLELALGKKQTSIEWGSALAAFLRCSTPILTCHIWMTFWSLDEAQNSNALKSCFYREVNGILSSSHQQALSRELQTCLIETVWLLESQQATLLSTDIDTKITNAVLRPPFNANELFLGYSSLNTEASAIEFPEAYRFFRGIKKARRLNKNNPLTIPKFKNVIPKDPSKTTTQFSKYLQHWTSLTESMTPVELEIHLKELIQDRYPNENKTMLDLIVANWIARGKDGTLEHSIIIDALLQANFRYHNQLAPFYAINEEFRQTSSNKFGNTQPYKFNLILTEDPPWLNPLDPDILHGCLRLLKQLAGSDVADTEAWVQDILKITSSQVIGKYVDWLSKEYTSSRNPRLEKHLLATMRNPRIQNWPALFYSYHAVPILLRNLDASSLASILEHPESGIITGYFSGCQQTEVTSLVIELLQLKPKVYFDLLLNHLKSNMNSIDTQSPQSRTWFQKHFIQPILLVAEENDNTAAAQLYYQLLTSNADFDWFLATYLSEQPENDPIFTLQGLELCKKHLILPVRSSGLASFMQEMIRMGDTGGRQRLVQYWNDAWTKTNGDSNFAVPIPWILQCIGLFKQSPYNVKNMTEHLVDIGLRGDTADHSFLRKLIDLMMLSDVPDVDSVLNMFSKRYDAVSNDELDAWIAWYITSIVIEVTEELYWQVKPIEDRKFAEEAVKQVSAKRTGTGRSKKRMVWISEARWKGMKKEEQQMIRSMRRWMQRKPTDNTQQKKSQSLIPLVQHILDFLSALVVPDGHPSLEISAKRRLRDRLVLYTLFYLPLSKLKRLLKQENSTLEKLQAFVVVCVPIVQNLDPSIAMQAQEILDTLYPTELGQEQRILAS